MGDYKGIERRSGRDRRARNLPWHKQLFTVGKRVRIRREEDRKRAALLDRYSTSLFGMIMLIIVLSLLDAFLTLILVAEHGAREANPILASYMAVGNRTFLVVKYMLTVFSIFLLLIYKEAIVLRFRAGRFVFVLVALIFSSVVVWEVYLFMIYT